MKKAFFNFHKSKGSPPIIKHSKGISLIALIVTIIVIIILAAISLVSNNDALKGMTEAQFKTNLRGMLDRLKIYHENASMENYDYQKERITISLESCKWRNVKC